MLSTRDREVLRKKEIVEKYYRHLIDEAIIFVRYKLSNHSLSDAVSSSMSKLLNAELAHSQARFSSLAKETRNYVERDIKNHQDAFEANVISLQECLGFYLSDNPEDKSNAILNEKINATRQLKNTLDSPDESSKKLIAFHTKLEEVNHTLRQHRNPGWDIFYTILAFPLAPFRSLFNRASYGTWNPFLTEGDIMVTEAKRNSR